MEIPERTNAATIPRHAKGMALKIRHSSLIESVFPGSGSILGLTLVSSAPIIMMPFRIYRKFLSRPYRAVVVFAESDSEFPEGF